MAKPSLAIMTPCRGGMTPTHVHSLLTLTASLTRQGIGWQWLVEQDKPIVHARHDLLARFRATGCTHALWTDADVGIRPETLDAMLATRQDFVSAPCLLRPRDGDVVRQLDRYNVVLEDLDQAPRNGAVRVDRTGFGCVLTSRACIERLVEAHPELAYPSPGPDANPRCGLFVEGVVDGAFRSEDYAFCRRWRALGGAIWAVLDCETIHAGAIGNFGRDVWSRRDELRGLREEIVRLAADGRVAGVSASTPGVAHLSLAETRAMVEAMKRTLANARHCQCGSGRAFGLCHGAKDAA
jgi:hypothetical protein